MSTASLPTLLYKVNIWSDESILNSYQLRLRETNRVWALQELGTILGQPESRWSPRHLLTDLRLVKSLGQLAGLPTDLSEEAPQPLLSAAEGKDTHVLRWGRGELSLQFWMQDFTQVCPECLVEKGYLDHSLDYWHVPVCAQHRCLLVDTCQECSKPLRFERPSLLQCGECGADLRESKVTAVDERLCELAMDMAALLPIDLVAGADSVALEPSQIAALVAHFVSAEHVESIASHLPAHTRSQPAAQRLAGLHWVADCLVGRRRIESGRLREALIRRTRYLEPFKGTPFMDWWLMDGLDSTDLGIRATNALAYGRADDLSHLEAHKRGAHRLSATSKRDLCTLLDVSAYEIEELVRHTSLQKEEDSIGYDAEALARAVAFYRACLTESELDQHFGIDGLTRELLGHGKLQEFAPRAAPHTRISPNSLNGFLSGLERSIPWSAEAGATMTLAQVAQRDGEPARAAARLLLGASSTATQLCGWGEPYRLVDLFCLASNLRRNKGNSKATLPKRHRGDKHD